MSYSPTIGRFLERDPETYTDGLSLYQMERSNPINRVDPFGTDSAPTTQPIAPPYVYPGEPPSPYPFAPGNGIFNGSLTYPGGVGNGGGTRKDGPDFDLAFLPKKGCGCTEIKFEQWIRETRSGAAIGNGSTAGFVIDDGGKSDTNKTPAWYPKQDPWVPGQRVNAGMRDAPNWSGLYIKREFIVYAVCTKGADAGKSYGTFRWNYTLVNGGGVSRGWFGMNGGPPEFIDANAGGKPTGPRNPAYTPDN